MKLYTIHFSKLSVNSFSFNDQLTIKNRFSLTLNSSLNLAWETKLNCKVFILKFLWYYIYIWESGRKNCSFDRVNVRNLLSRYISPE
jgi:hypothetical protein